MVRLSSKCTRCWNPPSYSLGEGHSRCWSPPSHSLGKGCSASGHSCYGVAGLRGAILARPSAPTGSRRALLYEPQDKLSYVTLTYLHLLQALLSSTTYF